MTTKINFPKKKHKSLLWHWLKDTPGMSQIVPGKIIQFYRRKVSGVDKVVNFKDFSRRNKEIKYFSRT